MTNQNFTGEGFLRLKVCHLCVEDNGGASLALISFNLHMVGGFTRLRRFTHTHTRMFSLVWYGSRPPGVAFSVRHHLRLLVSRSRRVSYCQHCYPLPFQRHGPGPVQLQGLHGGWTLRAASGRAGSRRFGPASGFCRRDGHGGGDVHVRVADLGDVCVTC